jgi:hypothetical protein
LNATAQTSLVAHVAALLILAATPDPGCGGT